MNKVPSTKKSKKPSLKKAIKFLRKGGKRKQKKVIEEVEEEEESSTEATKEDLHTTLIDLSAELAAIDNDENVFLLESGPSSFKEFVEEHCAAAATTQLNDDDLKEKIVEDYTQVLLGDAKTLNSADRPRDELGLHLLASTRIVHEYLAICERLHEISGETVQDHVFEIVESHVLSHVAMHYYDANRSTDEKQVISPVHAAKIISWMDSILSLVQQYCPDIKLSPDWQRDCELLKTAYVKELHRKFGEQLQRSLQLRDDDDDLRTNAKGEIVSGHPERVAFLLDGHIEVAQEVLPAQYLEAVLVACNQEISTMVADLTLNIEATASTRSSSTAPYRYCAIINDATRLADIVEQRNETHLVSDDSQTAGESTIRDVIQLSLHGTKFLCQRIISSVRDNPDDPILSGIGSSDWEADEEGTTIQQTIATFRDFFDDLETWLFTGYFFPKVLKGCFELTLETYVTSFYRNTMTAGVHKAAVAADRLNQDYTSLVKFFNGGRFEEYDSKAGFLSANQINTRLQVIQSMSRLVNPEIAPSDLVNDADAILAQTTLSDDDDQRAAAVVLHLAGLRKRQGSQRAAEWLRMMAHAEQALTESVRGQYSCCEPMNVIRLPDLRESTHLRNVRVNPMILHQMISEKSILPVESINQMVQAVPSPAKKQWTKQVAKLKKTFQ